MALGNKRAVGFFSFSYFVLAEVSKTLEEGFSSLSSGLVVFMIKDGLRRWKEGTVHPELRSPLVGFMWTVRT